jgi:hypothetical protein
MAKFTDPRVLDFRMLYRKPQVHQPEDTVWLVRERDGCTRDFLVKSVRLEVPCYGVYEPVRENAPVCYQVGCQGILSWEDDVVHILPDDDIPKRTLRAGGSRIRVRYNTDHIHSPKERPFRILTSNGKGFDEQFATSFAIVEGASYTTREVLPEVGLKWHIGCLGVIRWYGSHAHIVSYE